MLESLFLDARTIRAPALEQDDESEEDCQGLFHKVMGNLPRNGRQSTCNFKLIGLPRNIDRWKHSTSRQVFLREEQSLDPLAARDPVDDFSHVCRRDLAIKEMVGLDRNRHAARALVEAAARTDARL